MISLLSLLTPSSIMAHPLSSSISTSDSNSIPPSTIRPGPSPQGPQGWEEKRVEQVREQHLQESQGNHPTSLKEKIHRVGEKLHLVADSKDDGDHTEKGETKREAQRQVSKETEINTFLGGGSDEDRWNDEILKESQRCHLWKHKHNLVLLI